PYPQQPYPPYAPPGYPPPQQYQQGPYQQPVYSQPQYAPPPPPPPPAPPKQEPPPWREEPAASMAPPVEEPTRESARGSALFGAPAAPAERSQGMPTWLLTILCTAGFAALILGIYWLVGNSHRPPTPSATVESPAAKPGVAASPWQKFIEVSGIRFQED